jgi:hypothetical protein
MVQRPHNDLWREVCDGIREVQSYTAEQADAYHKSGTPIPPAIPTGGGNHVFTTQKSIDAIFAIARDWRAADDARKARISENPLGQLAVRVFGELFAENEFVIWDDEKAALSALKTRLKERVDATFRDADHYFPCHIVGSPSAPSFAVGGVRFLRRDEWLNHVAARSLDAKTWTDAVKELWNVGTALPEFNGRAKSDAKNTVETIGKCQWVAVVSVEGNELARSADRATYAARLAIDALGLVLSPSEALKMRGPGDDLHIRRTGTLSQFEGLGLNTGSHIDVPDLFSHPPFADSYINSTVELRADAGWAIEAMLVTANETDLAALKQRWCDALYWFGEARRDTTEFTALVRYGMCLDVLANGGKAGGIATMMADFMGGTITDALLTDGSSVKKVVEALYNDGRSRLGHGTRAALLNDLPFPLATADNLAQIALDRYLIYLRRYKGADEAKAFLTNIPALVATQKGLPPV